MTEQLTTTNILSLFETTKEERTSFVEDVLLRIENGSIDQIKVHLQLKCFEDIFKQITENKDYKTTLLQAAEHNGKKFTQNNAEFSVKEVGVKYDYSNCGDIVCNELMAQSAKIGDELKVRQKFLQTVPLSGLVVTNEETGETSKVYAPSKSSTTAVAVTLK